MREGFLANLAGSALDLLWLLIGVFGLDAVLTGLVRGEPDWAMAILGPLCAGLVALVVSRAARGRYEITIHRFGRVELTINTASVPYFVTDALWLAAAVQLTIWHGYPAAALIAAAEAALIALRITSRCRS
ncbi:hypothetical protein [Dactylosporangium sp. CA-139066]|uniref:hypothetical protein n=1 Tax=Dactylosporangium sp. CA-139066 TaxID=3239930 RepID=UPI003D9273F4